MFSRNFIFNFILVLSIGRSKARNESEIIINTNALNGRAIELIIEFAKWRSLNYIVIFDPFLNEGYIPDKILQLVDCMSKYTIYTSIYSTHVEITEETFRVSRHRLGVVVLIKCNEILDNNHVLFKASRKNLFNEQLAWLIITCNPEDNTVMLNTLDSLSLGMLSDFILAKALFSSNELEPGNVRNKSNHSCPISLPENVVFPSAFFNYYMKIFHQPSYKSKKFITANMKHNIFKSLISTNASINDNTETSSKTNMSENPLNNTRFYELVQIYKIRSEDNKSIVINTLGLWRPNNDFKDITPFQSVGFRQNFMGFPIIVGIQNWTLLSKNTRYYSAISNVYDTEVDDSISLYEILGFVVKSLNATVQFVPFQSVGTEIKEGVWSDLLNAVVTGQVDLGLEKVTVSYHKLDHMTFTHNIMKMRVSNIGSCKNIIQAIKKSDMWAATLNCCPLYPSLPYVLFIYSHNIYMHPSEYSVSKDIYLTSFSSKLLLCVLGIAILLAIIMLIVSTIANYRAKKSQKDVEPVNISYAALWIVGILTMQGSIWTPNSSSGNMTLILSLMFAMIIYNSYAAFITSILSVKSSDINSLQDLFENGYKVGYIQNSEDEQYLQKQTDELKTIYLQGYNSKVENIEQGLLLAARTRYALFVSTPAARRTINILSPYDCRCQIQEFALRSTVEDVAFPMNKTSPYHKLINLGIMRLIESGTLDRIQKNMIPDMPTCSSDSSFVNAQLEDVLTAVKLLGIGIILSIIVAIGECMINYRKELRTNIKARFFKVGRKIKQTVENFEF